MQVYSDIVYVALQLYTNISNIVQMCVNLSTFYHSLQPRTSSNIMKRSKNQNLYSEIVHGNGSDPVLSLSHKSLEL